MSNLAISIQNISKTFKIPKEKNSTLRGTFVNAFGKNKGFEKFDALKNVSFEVKKGEFFGIIGRNGSGKSTLLKILAGIYSPDKGEVEINGLISPFLELGIGFNPELSGRDNVYLNASVLGLTKKQIDERFDDIVAFSELRRFIDQKVKNYSSGMQVRLAFSVAIHANRDILLMDEVLAVGDSNFQGKCMEEFNKYKDAGKTVILVTHDISTVQRYCDRAMLLRNGKVEMIGDPEKVGNKYIYQNMSDEEKRLFNEERRLRLKAEKEAAKNQKEETKKPNPNTPKPRNKIAEITGVEFLDGKGNMKNVFQTGESIGFKIKFKTYKKNIPINFGLGLHSFSGGQVFGYATQAENIKIRKNITSITLYFKSLPILKGEYFINVSCFRNIGETCYDFKPKYRTLRVYSKGVANNYVGLVDIEHSWNF